MKLGQTNFEVRTGEWTGSVQAGWGDGGGVTQMSNNKIRLAVKSTPTFRSAGILGPMLAPLTRITLNFEGRLDAFDPSFIFGVWSRDDTTGEEFDFLEASRYNHAGRAELYHGQRFLAGTTDPMCKKSWLTNAFKIHKLVIEIADENVTADLFGIHKDGNVKQIHYWNSDINLPYKDWTKQQLRIAMFLPQSGPYYPDAGSRGLGYVTLTDFKMEKL